MAPKYSPKRRRIYNKGPKINRLEIFERDEWVCHICGKQIDRDLRFPDRMAATLDHVIPLAHGGGHCLDNLATAHAQCNYEKGCQSNWTRFAF